jgi:hypothetical protein
MAAQNEKDRCTAATVPSMEKRQYDTPMNSRI